MRINRILSLVLITILSLTMIIACTTPGRKTPGNEISQTIETRVEGHNGEMTIIVTVEGEIIRSVEVTDHKETESIAGTVFEKLPVDIVNHQSVAIDSVSGATISSTALLSGVKTALETAGLDGDKFMNKPEPDPVAGKTINMETDVIIVGAGAAGLAAATKVTEAGKRVVILEKMPMVGGNAIRAGGAINAANPERQKNQMMSQSELDVIIRLTELQPKNEDMARWQNSVKADIDKYIVKGDTYLYDSTDLHKLQTYVGGDYLGDTKLINFFCDNAPEAVKWLESKGIEFKTEIQAVIGAVWKRSHALVREDEKGVAIIEPLEEAALSGGAELFLNTKAEELIMTDGKVTGVTAVNLETNDMLTVNATKGVILATGGFGANVKMRTKYNTSGKWKTLGSEIPTSNHPGATGDGIFLAQAVGGDMINLNQIQLIPTWPRSGGGTIKGYIDNTIYVNQNGKRYVREDGRRDELSMAALRQPGGFFYVINDHKDAIKNGFSQEIIDYMVANGYIWRGDSVEELGEAMGVDPAALKDAVDTFNKSVDGAPDPLGRKLFDQKIESSPFYAASFTPAVHHTMGGLRINEKTQVLDTNGNPIKGLFAAGEVTGGLHGTNRLGGNAIPDCIVYGMVAGEQIIQ